MRLIHLAIVSLGTAAVLGSASTLGIAQSFEANSPSPSQASFPRQNAAPTRISQASSAPNFPLLAKVANTFLQSDRAQTESTMRLSGSNAGINFSMEIQARTIVQTPNKFRAEVTGTPVGKTQPIKTLVVSDGKQVWIYRADLKQYTVMPYAKFDQLDDSYMVGMSSLLFLAMAPDLRPLVAQGAFSDASVQKELAASANGALRGGVQTLDQQNVYVYEYRDDKQGFVYKAFVEPTTAAIKQLQLTGKASGLDISVVEKVLRRAANPSVTANTFKFTPPQTAKRVKSLAIAPL